MSEDVDNPTSPRQQLAWMARSETESSETDDMTSHESDLENDEEYDDDDDEVPLEPTRGERLLQIAQEGEGVDRLEKESKQEHARMTQSDTDSPMTDDDTTSSESDSESDREYEDNLTEQTRGERLEMAKEAIKAEESENNARTRAEAARRLLALHLEPPDKDRRQPGIVH
jgi:acyl transferase domain-containing protein